MKWPWRSNRNEPEEEPKPAVNVVEDETPEQQHQRLHPGICPGCGHPIDDHPREGVNLACNEWYR